MKYRHLDRIMLDALLAGLLAILPVYYLAKTSITLTQLIVRLFGPEPTHLSEVLSQGLWYCALLVGLSCYLYYVAKRFDQYISDHHEQWLVFGVMLIPMMAVIVVVFISPVQRVVNVEVTDTVGVTPEVDTFTVSFLLHPAVLIPVTMYEVVTVGLAVGLAKVVLFKPAPGLHK